MSVIDLSLIVSHGFWGFGEDEPHLFENWGRLGTGTDGLAWYPTDFLRDVVPIPCHSHNDYWRKVPFFSAVKAGCTGVEADVWLFDDDADATLLVGHDTAALTAERTFESLYVFPILELLERMNPQTPYYNDTRRGIFDVDPEQSLTLLVDVKTDGAKAWPRVLEQLEPLRERGWLSYVENDVVHTRQVTVVGTGNTPFDVLMENRTYRDAFFDAPIDEMWEDPDSDEVVTTPTKYNSTNSFYASVSLRATAGLGWYNPSKEKLRIIRGQIKGAHRRGLKARYWDTPAWPIQLRNKVWHLLEEQGIDMLNVDDLRAASKKAW